MLSEARGVEAEPNFYQVPVDPVNSRMSTLTANFARTAVGGKERRSGDKIWVQVHRHVNVQTIVYS